MPHSGYTICTSEQLLTSTTVSHGFVMEWHSSPPFGSHGPCKHSKPCPLDVGTGVPCSSCCVLPTQHTDREPQPWSELHTACITERALLSCAWRTAAPHHIWRVHRVALACLHCALAAFHVHTCQHARSMDSLVCVLRRAVCGTVAPSTTAIDFTRHHPEGRKKHSSHHQSGEPATPLNQAPLRLGTSDWHARGRARVSSHSQETPASQNQQRAEPAISVGCLGSSTLLFPREAHTGDCSRHCQLVAERPSSLFWPQALTG